ncbi:MAG: hypothetical protein ACOYN3_10065 [Acidimicrobiia bacterium]
MTEGLILPTPVSTRRWYRSVAIVFVAVIAAALVVFNAARPAAAQITSSNGTGGLAAVLTCDPNFGNRAVFGDVKMKVSNNLASQYVITRIGVQQVGTTALYWGPWTAPILARRGEVASLAPSAGTAPLSFNRNQFWDVYVQGGWYVNGVWQVAQATAKQGLPASTAYDTRTPYLQRSQSVFGGSYWSPNCRS